MLHGSSRELQRLARRGTQEPLLQRLQPRGVGQLVARQVGEVEHVHRALANRGRLADRLVAKPAARPRADAFAIQPNVLIDNAASNRFTVVEVNARDRPALLGQLANALFQSKVTIHSAHVATYGERAVDVFYLTDLTGDRLTDRARLRALERRLLDAAAGEPLELAA